VGEEEEKKGGEDELEDEDLGMELAPIKEIETLL